MDAGSYLQNMLVVPGPLCSELVGTAVFQRLGGWRGRPWPTGTMTLLLAVVEGSTRLWQTQPEDEVVADAGGLDTQRVENSAVPHRFFSFPGHE